MFSKLRTNANEFARKALFSSQPRLSIPETIKHVHIVYEKNTRKTKLIYSASFVKQLNLLGSIVKQSTKTTQYILTIKIFKTLITYC